MNVHLLFRSLFSLLILGFFFPAAHAQITITSSDISVFFAPGNEFESRGDTVAASYNIGSTGGGNSWDFSGVVANEVFTQNVVDPASTSFFDRFSGATVAIQGMFSQDTITAEGVNYLSLDNDGLNELGFAIATEVEGLEGTFITRYEPALPTFVLPMTFGDSWTYEGTLGTEIESMGEVFPFENSEVNSTSSVDAYGSLTFPDGSTEEVIRIKSVEETITAGFLGGPGDTSVFTDYIFVAKSGKVVAIGADGEGPDSGNVLGALTWTTTDATTSVDPNRSAPVAVLHPASPNPLRQQTQIQYELPRAAWVDLQVVDISGRVIQKLDSGQKPSGMHQVRLNGARLAAGTYFVYLKVDDHLYTSTLQVQR